MSDKHSSSFDLLDDRIKRWIWSEGWTELRDAQEQAIEAIVAGDGDVIIAAATAAGKTEAAFLPILTNMLQADSEPVLTIYISPLKALINDQFGRLDQLCKLLDVHVWPWHGDISNGLKQRFYKAPSGILLITPESLEAMLCNRGFTVPRLFSRLQYIVVDELHAFIGAERGKQLQSLMHRLDAAIGRNVPRIGLSATLGDMGLAADFLRPHRGNSVRVIESKSGGGELKVRIKGYIEVASKTGDGDGGKESKVESSITHHLFQALRGSNNLVFPNSRSQVELYTYNLRKLCEMAKVPNEFWPHHGSLSREIREETEAALKDKEKRATAICTNTLELGIDIGAVKSIAQIGPPPSVASLRQRLGRSGRRKGEPAILRGYATESELSDTSDLATQLRNDLFEMSAMVSLLLEGWFEPPKVDGFHLSTFVQQLLSLIAQRGGIAAADAYRTLCQTGPFDNIDKSDFVELLRHFGTLELLQQDAAGVFLHGPKGEPLVNHYSFYSAFASEEEFRLVASHQTLGSLPISCAVSVGDYILFAAKTWRIDQVDEEGKTIFVTRHVAGKPPTFMSGGNKIIHDRVRQRMRELYARSDAILFVDDTASRLIEEGRLTYQRHELDTRLLTAIDGRTMLFTWLGDRANHALVAMLKVGGFSAAADGPAIEIGRSKSDNLQVAHYLVQLADAAPLGADILLQGAENLRWEKWDWALPDALLRKSFASLRLDIVTAHHWLVENRNSFISING